MFTIRKYKTSDKKQVEHIHYETGFLGKSMNKIFDNKKLWAYEAKYYLEKEPESCFVLVDNQTKKIVGYLFGCLDDNKHNEIKKGIIGFFRSIIYLPFSNKKDRKYFFSKIKFLMRIIFNKSQELKLKYPHRAGHIHINLLPQARRQRLGTKLLNKFEEYAKSKGVKTIHAGSFSTRLNQNQNFWIKNKFKIYDEKPTTYWKTYYPKEKITVRIYSKKL